MSEQIFKQQDELANLIERNSGQDGVNATTIPSLYCIRESRASEPIYGVNKPSLCIVLQGEKEVYLSQERFRYGPVNYIVASVDLPVSGQVIKASSDAPYLALKLEFTPGQILEVLCDADIQIGKRRNAKRAMFVSKADPSLLDVVIRLTNLLTNPTDIPVLAPLYTKEIIYKALQGQHGDAIKQMAIEGSSAYQIRKVIEYIINNYDLSFRIEELAKIANMSVASLYRHFKEITAMSPIQFQKQLRLQEARRLLLSKSIDATGVAFQVGYESPSQFSREYSRMFGLPPKEDINRLKEKYG